MNRLRRICFTLAIVLGLSLATADVSIAAPRVAREQAGIGEPASPATPCWPKGTRVKKSTEGRVYVIGPQYYLYWIPTPSDYNALYGSWDGILSVSPAKFDSCYHNGSLTLSLARLLKNNSRPEVYIWEAPELGYSQIADWNTFINVYHFDPAKIDVTTSAVLPRSGFAWD